MGEYRVDWWKQYFPSMSCVQHWLLQIFLQMSFGEYMHIVHHICITSDSADFSKVVTPIYPLTSSGCPWWMFLANTWNDQSFQFELFWEVSSCILTWFICTPCNENWALFVCLMAMFFWTLFFTEFLFNIFAPFSFGYTSQVSLVWNAWDQQCFRF